MKLFIRCRMRSVSPCERRLFGRTAASSPRATKSNESCSTRGNEAKRDDTLAQYKNSDANISDFMVAKEGVENYLEVIVIALFALGSLMAGLGRALEMSATRNAAGEG